MHEVGITQSIIEIAERHARAQGASRVLSVTVAIGELSGVVADSVDFCFEACARGTFLEGARLIIDAIAGRGRCGDCRAEVALDPYTFACPACGGFALERLQGEELRITELEVE
ncbi:MAG: hydrogenase maturation nickel metallochaperone HypA [Desulfuromonadales bacterium]|jgi:hydrogenase nickel incorporation protein HypA/HybF